MLSDEDLLKLYQTFHGDSHLAACRAVYVAGQAAPWTEVEESDAPAPDALD